MSCLICLEVMSDTDTCTLDCCQVQLHTQCWLKWGCVFSGNSCPNCRATTKCDCDTHNQQILMNIILESQQEINRLIQDIRMLKDENLAIRMRSQADAVQVMFDQFEL